MTTTSNFLKIQAGPQHLVTLRAAPGPKQGTDPREVGFHFNRRPSKDGQPLTPTCVNCQLPTREYSGGNAPLISGLHRCGGEKLLLWAERDGVSRVSLLLIPNPEMEPGSPALQADSLSAALPGKNNICIK